MSDDDLILRGDALRMVRYHSQNTTDNITAIPAVSIQPMIDAAVAEALERAATMIEKTAYTSSGHTRSLEPVSAGLVGMDMHHATIAAAIRALIAQEGGK